MKPLNYLRQAEEELRGKWIPLIKTVAPETANICDEILTQCKEAVKFVMPEGGRILKDKLKGLNGLETIRLPYPSIVIEYPATEHQHGLVERLVGEGNTFKAPKRIVFAWENEGKIFVHSIIQGEHKGNKGWTMQPVIAAVWANQCDESFKPDFCSASREDERVDFISSVVMPAGELYTTGYGDPSDVNGKERAYADMIDESNAVLELIEALSCSNVSHEALPVQKMNKSAAKRGAAPFDEYRVLVVKNGSSKEYQPHGGSHGSPREHLRRGHIRILATGKRIWINSCVVNAGVGGRIEKSYDMRKAA
jgi:hypothetical protein